VDEATERSAQLSYEGDNTVTYFYDTDLYTSAYPSVCAECKFIH